MISKSDLYYEITRLAASGCLSEAARSLDAFRSKMRFPEMIECKGNISYYSEKYQDAADLYEQAMNSDETYDVARYHYLVGLQEASKGNTDEAIRRLTAAIDIEPTFPDSYYHLGNLFIGIGRRTSAIHVYDELLQRVPGDINGQDSLVMTLTVLANDHPEEFAARRDIEAAKFNEMLRSTRDS